MMASKPDQPVRAPRMKPAEHVDASNGKVPQTISGTETPGAMLKRIAAAAGLFMLTGVTCVYAQSLKGSRTAMRRQNSVAQQQDYTFLVTASEVRRFVEKGLLVPITGDANYTLQGVSFPYARSAVKAFVERLAPQYKAACGEKLVVTSLTRPMSRQPRNASQLSVHPAGIAVDLRQSRTNGCRRWLEGALAAMESKGLVEATRERRPAHYHVAVFPPAYERYLASADGQPNLGASGTGSEMKIAKVTTTPSYASVLPVGSRNAGMTIKSSASFRYTVKRGDSLWSIARRYGLKTAELKAANGLRRTTIQPGQTLTIPGHGRTPAAVPSP
jgi:LysM repeat protein